MRRARDNVGFSDFGEPEFGINAMRPASGLWVPAFAGMTLLTVGRVEIGMV